MGKLLKDSTLQNILTGIQGRDSKLESIICALMNRSGAGENVNVMSLNNRLEVVENAVTQILLSLENIDQYPDYANLILENFQNTNMLDTCSVKVTSITVSDDDIDVYSTEGLYPGNDYIISDGIHSEGVKIKSVNKLNGINRVVLTEPVQYSYNLATTQMFRTNAVISKGSASDPGKSLSETWAANINWQGLDGSTPFVITAAPNISESASFSMSDNMQITSDGYFTLND